MFWWVLNALLSSANQIIWKKSLSISTISGSAFYFFGLFGTVILSVIFIVTGYCSIPNWSWIFVLPIIDAFVLQYTSSLSQKICTTEKLSSIMPYDNLSSVLTIIAAFFLFNNTSITTLIIALVIVGIIFYFSFDFKKFEFPEKIFPILIWKWLIGLRQIGMAYALILMVSPVFFTLRNIASFVVFFLVIFVMREKLSFRGASKEFLVYRSIGSTVYVLASYISFTLLHSLGLIVTTLLGFLGMITTLVFQGIFLKEIPEKKDVILSLGIAVLVGIGAYYR